MSNLKWVVSIRGKAGSVSWEISVVKSTNEHGQQSCGWFNKNKLLIGHNGGPCDVKVGKFVFRELTKLAHELADKLNSGITLKELNDEVKRGKTRK